MGRRDRERKIALVQTKERLRVIPCDVCGGAGDVAPDHDIELYELLGETETGKSHSVILTNYYVVANFLEKDGEPLDFSESESRARLCSGCEKAIRDAVTNAIQQRVAKRIRA